MYCPNHQSHICGMLRQQTISIIFSPSIFPSNIYANRNWTFCANVMPNLPPVHLNHPIGLILHHLKMPEVMQRAVKGHHVRHAVIPFTVSQQCAGGIQGVTVYVNFLSVSGISHFIILHIRLGHTTIQRNSQVASFEQSSWRTTLGRLANCGMEYKMTANSTLSKTPTVLHQVKYI